MKKNICHICSNFDTFFVDFMEEQEKRNLNFRVFYFRGRERGMPDISAPNLDIRLNHNQWMRYFFFLKEYFVYKDFLDFYRDENFSLLHAHTIFSNGYIAYKHYKKTGIPYIVAVRDTDLNIFFKYRLFLRPLGRKILLHAKKIIFLSENYKIQLCDYFLNEKEKKIILSKSEVIPNGVNSFFIMNQKKKRKKDLDKKIKILTVGHIMKRKNQLKVCEAIQILVDEGYEVEYVVVGKVLDNKYFKQIESYEFIKYIPFLKKEELLEIYNYADIFVMPSMTETFGLTYIEALTQGLPIVYTKNQGIDGYFSNGTVGESVDARDSNDISNSIKKIACNYNQYTEIIGENVSNFNWKEINDRYIILYENLLGELQDE